MRVPAKTALTIETDLNVVLNNVPLTVFTKKTYHLFFKSSLGGDKHGVNIWCRKQNAVARSLAVETGSWGKLDLGIALTDLMFGCRA
jgi:hypothetical protein